jgi:hypothetical protein
MQDRRTLYKSKLQALTTYKCTFMHEPNPFRRFRIKQFSSPGKKPVDADDVFHVFEQGNGSPFMLVGPYPYICIRVGRPV